MHKIADMSTEPQDEAKTEGRVDVRNVEPDIRTNSLIEVWRARQEAKGKKLKKGEAVVELTKIGLQSEGITE